MKKKWVYMCGRLQRKSDHITLIPVLDLHRPMLQKICVKLERILKRNKSIQQNTFFKNEKETNPQHMWLMSRTALQAFEE